MKKELLILMLTSGILTSNHILSQATKINDKNLIGIFDGRTPCQELAKQLHEITIPECIKIKWRLVLYQDPKTHKPTTYLLNRSHLIPLEYPGTTGPWGIITGKDGRIIYELKSDNESTPTYLLKLDENILAFTDAKGNLLVGNEDFSYTLSRKW